MNHPTQAIESRAISAASTDTGLERLVALDAYENDRWELMQDLAEMEELRAKTSPRRMRPHF